MTPSRPRSDSRTIPVERIYEAHRPSGALQEGARHVRKEVVPSIQGAEGLLAAYWAIDRQNGKPGLDHVVEKPRASLSAPTVLVSFDPKEADESP